MFVVFFPQLNLQERLKMAEEQIVSNNDAESDQSESVEDLKAEVERREKALRNAEEERDTFLSELEELDRQNQEATQVWLTIVASLSLLLFYNKGYLHSTHQKSAITKCFICRSKY